MSGFDVELYKQIQEDARNEVINIDGRTYTTKRLEAKKPPQAYSLNLGGLQALIDFAATDEVKKIAGERPLFCSVDSQTEVRLFTGVEDLWLDRNTLALVEVDLPQLGLGGYQDREVFNIFLQSRFVENEDRGLLLDFISRLKEEVSSEVEDDGISQIATIKQGVAKVGKAKVPNPVTLAPYRTFLEIEQPESPFIFRMRSGFQCALIEADGGAWRIEAKKRIKDYLKERLPEDIIVLA